MDTLACVILAAGRGARMGGVAKALLVREGRTFLDRIVGVAREVGVEEIVVVVGPPYGDAVAEAARALGVDVKVNEEPERGMASSIAIGFAGVKAARALLWPVDHPSVRVDTVRALIAQDADVVVPRHQGAGGHPAVIAKTVYASLGTAPANQVLRDPQWRRIDLLVDDPGVVRDVDTW